MADDMQDLSRHLMAVIAAQLEAAHDIAMEAQSTHRPSGEQTAIVAQLGAAMRDIEALTAAATVIDRLSRE